MGREQTNHYVKALDVKQEADQVSLAMIEENDGSYDLNPSDTSVVMDGKEINTGKNISYAKIRGFASFQGSQAEPESVEMQADVIPDRGYNRTLTRRNDGDLIRYTRQSFGSEAVEHMVHDTATDTFNYFLRNDKGQFVKED